MDLGMSMLFDTLLKKLNIDPEEIKKNIAAFGQIAVNADTRLNALKVQQDRLERKLNLLLDAKGLDYAGTEINPAGTIGGPEPAAVDVGGTVAPG